MLYVGLPDPGHHSPPDGVTSHRIEILWQSPRAPRGVKPSNWTRPGALRHRDGVLRSENGGLVGQDCLCRGVRTPQERARAVDAVIL